MEDDQEHRYKNKRTDSDGDSGMGDKNLYGGSGGGAPSFSSNMMDAIQWQGSQDQKHPGEHSPNFGTGGEHSVDSGHSAGSENSGEGMKTTNLSVNLEIGYKGNLTDVIRSKTIDEAFLGAARGDSAFTKNLLEMFDGSILMPVNGLNALSSLHHIQGVGDLNLGNASGIQTAEISGIHNPTKSQGRE